MWSLTLPTRTTTRPPRSRSHPTIAEGAWRSLARQRGIAAPGPKPASSRPSSRPSVRPGLASGQA
eukprot:scaffold90296_cov68-Phaeocystis_antarctica.AAC.10